MSSPLYVYLEFFFVVGVYALSQWRAQRLQESDLTETKAK